MFLYGGVVKIDKNDPLMIAVQKSIVWKIIKEKKLNGPFGKTAKVRVVCGIQLGKCFYGENWGGKSKKEQEEYAYNSRLKGVLIDFSKKNNLKIDKIPSRVYDAYGQSYNLGTCAEDDAASKLLNFYAEKKHKFIDVEHLVFSSALDPKTMKNVKYCITCKTIFDL